MKIHEFVTEEDVNRRKSLQKIIAATAAVCGVGGCATTQEIFVPPRNKVFFSDWQRLQHLIKATPSRNLDRIIELRNINSTAIVPGTAMITEEAPAWTIAESTSFLLWQHLVYRLGSNTNSLQQKIQKFRQDIYADVLQYSKKTPPYSRIRIISAVNQNIPLPDKNPYSSKPVPFSEREQYVSSIIIWYSDSIKKALADWWSSVN